MPALPPWPGAAVWLVAAGVAGLVACGGGGRRVTLASFFLALLALPLTLEPPHPGPEPTAPAVLGAARLAECLAPSLLVEQTPDRPRLLREALLDEEPRAVPLRHLYVGLCGLLLAALGALTARARTAWIPRLLLLAALAVLGGAAGPRPPAQLAGALAAAQASLLVLAGFGLASLRPLSEPAPAGPALALGSAAVLLAGVLGACAAWAGSATPAELLAPWRALLPPGTVVDDLALQSSAGHLVEVLDRAALAAFASMTALLLHLKGRSLPSLLLLLAVAAADLLAARGLLA